LWRTLTGSDRVTHGVFDSNIVEASDLKKPPGRQEAQYITKHSPGAKRKLSSTLLGLDLTWLGPERMLPGCVTVRRSLPSVCSRERFRD
jgi:hypothetical protein